MRFCLVLFFYSFLSFAQNQSVSTPYLNQLKEEIEEEDQTHKKNKQSHIQEIRKKLEPLGTEGVSFIEELKEENPELREKPARSSYIEKEQEKLKSTQKKSPILSYRKHEPPTLYKSKPPFKHGFSLKVSTGGTRDYSAADEIASGRTFQDVYPQRWTPDITLTYDYRFFSHETVGNMGLQIGLGLAVHRGKGLFSKALRKGWDPTELFSEESNIRYNFLTLPVSVGFRAQLDVLKVIRPYAHGGFLTVAFAETRSDQRPDSRVISLGASAGGGILIPLSWLSHKNSWDLYSDYGIKAYYLNVDFTHVATLAGDVDLVTNQLSAGFTFEF